MVSLVLYQNLYKYINYFENEDGSSIYSWSSEAINGDGTAMSPYPVYNKEFTGFIDEVYSCGILDLDYIATLKRKELPFTDEMIVAIGESDFDTLRAILSFYICQEHFCEGLWILASQNKIFSKILARMQKLEEIKYLGE